MVKRGCVSISDKGLSHLVSPHKVKIIQILRKDKKLNLSQLQAKLKISSKETRRHTKGLVNAGILKKKRQLKQPGKPVFLSLKRRG
jgi:predicted ArsR family transcriptional regulator